MILVRTTAFALALAVAAALSTTATAQQNFPQADAYDSASASYSLVGGVWIGDQVDSKGRVTALAFRNDGGCLMGVFDTAGNKLGHSGGSFTLYGNQLTLNLSVGSIVGTLTYFGPNSIQIVDGSGAVLTFKRVTS